MAHDGSDRVDSAGGSPDGHTRGETNDALRRSEATLKSIFRAAPAGIGMVRDRIVCEVNERVCAMTGYAREELVGRSARMLYPTQEDYDHVGREKYGQIRERGVGTVETRWVRKDGEVIDVLLSSAPIDPEDLSVGVTFTAMDISERKRLGLRLRQSEKMEAIGQLAGGVAHDFNNQLAGIMGYADLIREAVEHDPVLARYAGRIIDTCGRAANLTNQLLAFARKGKYRTMSVDIHRCIEDAILLLERAIDKRIEIRREFGASPSLTLGDPTQLQNAILNLGLNARDAMPEGGRMSFSTAVRELDEGYCAAGPFGLSAGSYIEVAVSDTGCGIPPDTLKHIFEPFFTTKEPGKGTGMGLAAVFGTVKSHHGAITVDRNPEGGTVFTLLLPSARGEHRVLKTKMIGCEEKPPLRSRRILLVDDEVMVHEMAADVLRSLGYTVTVCRDGGEAVALYAESWREFDLVILDMVMPVMAGREAFREMRRINPGVKALLSSGYTIDGEAREVLREGVLGFLQKPFRKSELARRVVEALGDGE
jgi:PAS domain S-box-containing protein